MKICESKMISLHDVEHYTVIGTESFF